MTIKQIKKAIAENNLSIFDFTGFNSKRDTELKNELLRTLREKYSRPRDTDDKRIQRAGKTNEAKAYFLLKHRRTEPQTERQAMSEPKSIPDFYGTDVENESDRTPIQKQVIKMLLEDL